MTLKYVGYIGMEETHAYLPSTMTIVIFHRLPIPVDTLPPKTALVVLTSLVMVVERLEQDVLYTSR